MNTNQQIVTEALKQLTAQNLTSRISRDVDFAVLMPGKEANQRVRDAQKNKSYNETKQNAFVMISPMGIQTDLLFHVSAYLLVPHFCRKLLRKT